MQKINDCFNKVKKDCFRFILSQETKKDKFKNKDKMIKSFLIPVSFWIAEKTNKKKPFIIGLAGGQGTGKTTISSILTLIFSISQGGMQIISRLSLFSVLSLIMSIFFVDLL